MPMVRIACFACLTPPFWVKGLASETDHILSLTVLERFEYSQSRKLHPMKSSFTEHSGEEPIAEVTVKQPLK